MLNGTSYVCFVFCYRNYINWLQKQVSVKERFTVGNSVSRLNWRLSRRLRLA